MHFWVSKKVFLFVTGGGGQRQGGDFSPFFFLKTSLIVRIFDEIGDGFISVEKFKFILKEIDEDFTDEELEEVILEV